MKYHFAYDGLAYFMLLCRGYENTKFTEIGIMVYTRRLEVWLGRHIC